MLENVNPEKIQHGTEQCNYAVYRHDIQNLEYEFETHWHKEYEIIYVKEGFFNFLVDGTYFRVWKGQALFLDQEAIHTFPEENLAEGKYVSLLFGQKFLFPSSNSYIFKRFYSEIIPHRVSLTQLITEEGGWRTEILHQIQQLDQLSDSIFENALAIQIHLLTILDTLRKEKAYVILQNQMMMQNESIREALLYIHQNYDKKITVNELAESLHISVNHFIRIFKNALGTTPQQYIQMYRIKQAIAMMNHYEMDALPSITAIASEVGFSDVNYFTRSFKKMTGFTPSQYQKKSRK